MDCEHCGRDLRKYGYSSGDTLSGYELASPLCRKCNQASLRSIGMEDAARQDEIKDLIVVWFWRGMGIVFIVIPAILCIIGLLSGNA